MTSNGEVKEPSFYIGKEGRKIDRRGTEISKRRVT
jgi:hypothetical protein